MIASTVRSFHELLQRPSRVLWLCLAVGGTSLALDGSALRLWSLRRDHRALEAGIDEARARARALEFRIHEAQRPEFIERQARDQFDLVREGDLVFVFSDDSPEAP